MDTYRNSGKTGKVVEINRINQREPWIGQPADLYPNTPPWGYYVVHISEKGMVLDKLSRFGSKRIPLSDWTKYWEKSEGTIWTRIK